MSVLASSRQIWHRRADRPWEIPANRYGRAGSRFEHGNATVIFFFEQGGQYVRCEVHPREDGASELIVTKPGGGQTVEVVAGSELTRRVEQLEATMINAGWWGPLGRDF